MNEWKMGTPLMTKDELEDIAWWLELAAEAYIDNSENQLAKGFTRKAEFVRKKAEELE